GSPGPRAQSQRRRTCFTALADGMRKAPPPLQLLAGLDRQTIGGILARMSRRRFDAEQPLCRQGDAGDSLYLIMDGLVEIWLEQEGERRLIARLRPGDAVGEMSLLTGEPRAASIVAAVPTEILELDARTFAGVLAEHPMVLRNVALMLIERQKLTNEQVLLRRERGEALALVMGEGSAALADQAIAAAERASPREVAVIDMTGKIRRPGPSVAADCVADVLTALDRMLAAQRTVIVTVDCRQSDLHLILRELDRTVYLLSEAEARRLKACIGAGHATAEWVLIGGHAGSAQDGLVPLRRIALPASERDRRWLGRHLARTRLGLALGAGGAKSYAHVGALAVLEGAGYEVDCVAGASFGAIVGSCIAMGMDAGQARRQLDHLLSLDICGPYFGLLAEANPEGPEVFYRALSELAGERTCENLSLPLGILTADLNAQLPHAFVAGPLAQALCAALAIPGLAPPYQLGSRRLIDGVTISPVPVRLAEQLGADITVAVNLMSRAHLDAWPQTSQPGPAPAGEPHHLDPVVETIIMLQTDTSMRNADEADVTITPRFAPSSWRDIHLAKLFEAAGRDAALGQLDKLRSLARPPLA
ncbi:MAG: patatin-like phospholipase family protein, partial [Geminicoccaceae bacterium]